MNFCYYLRYYPTLSETFAWGEARELLRMGHAARCVAISAREDGALARDLPDWEVLTPRLPGALAPALRGLASGPGREAARWLLRFQPPRRVALAARAAAEARPGERLHAHFAGEAAEWAAFGAMARGLPFGVTVHAVDLFRPRPSFAELLGKARVVLTVSRWNAGQIRALTGVEARVVYCGVEPGRWPAADPAAGRTVVSVGRNVPKKGLDRLAKALASLPEISGRIVSDAPELAGANVEVLGPRPQAEIAEILASAALFALPCRVADDGDRDGLPVALMEAMACGLPVITTALPGFEELVDEEVGWVVPPDQPDALREALAEAMARPDERARRGRAARSRVLERFTLQAQARGLVEAWEERA